MYIIPSILVQTEAEFLQQTKAVEKRVPMVQIDIADGLFVPNTTWADPESVKNNLHTTCELHLMVVDPLSIIKKWIGVPQVKRVLFPLEYTGNINEVIEAIQQNGWQASLVINPETKIEALAPYLEKIDGAMFMGVHPGRQGQELIPEVLEKISEFKKIHPEIWIELDGGVTTKNLGDILRAGADAVCPGSAIFGNQFTPAENLSNFEQQLIELKNWQF